MTVAPDVPRLAAADPGEAIRRLARSPGLRLSTARRLIIEALFAADGPVAAQQLAEELSIDESSVYRNLELLERQGLTRHVHLGHGPGLYALVGRDEGEYLYCERCGKVTLLGPEELDAGPRGDPRALRVQGALHPLRDRRGLSRSARRRVRRRAAPHGHAH